MKKILFLLISVCVSNLMRAQTTEENLIWKFDSEAINCTPVVDGNTVFIGSMDRLFYAINIESGKEKWRYATLYPITSNAVVAGDLVLFRSGNCLLALNKTTGEKVWEYTSTTRPPTIGTPTNYNHSSPVINNGIVYFADELGQINGIDLNSGNRVFYFKTGMNYERESDYCIASTPAITENVIYFGDNGAHMFAVSLTDSTELWSQKVYSPKWDGSVVSEVVVKDSAVYFGGYNNFFSPINRFTGEPIWSFQDDSTFLPSTPVFYKNDVIVGSTIWSKKIHSLSMSDGTENWNFKAKGIFFVKPQIINDSILVISSTEPFGNKVGVLYFLNCEDGTEINKINIPNATESSPVCLENGLLIGTGDGLCYFDYRDYIR